MSVERRKELIGELENKLQTRVMTLVTGDRQGMETRIAPDLLPLIAQHLASMGPVKDLSLFIYTPGGDTIVGWGLVNLFRQYCNNFNVLVPFRSLSCGTLIALGADKIIMGRRGLLSPVDPSVSSPFNPQAPGPQQSGMVSLLPVSVEDMIGFLDLARKEIGLKTEESMVSALKILSDKIHPLALGAIYRAREQTSDLAKRLLSKHSNDETKIDKIISKLTKELPTHNYLIGREEAENSIKLDITEPSQEVDNIMWELYKEYEEWLQLTRPFSAELDLGADSKKRISYYRAAVESKFDNKLSQHVFVTDNEIIKISSTPPGLQVPLEQTIVRTIFQGWLAFTNGEAIK